MLRRKGLVVLCAALLFCLGGQAGEALARVEIEDSGPVEDKVVRSGVELTQIERTIGIKAGGHVHYTLFNRYIPGPEVTGEEIDEDVLKKLPSFPQATLGLGIGLTHPGRAAWYWNGFIGVQLDGRSFAGVPEEIRMSGGDDRGTVEFVYDEDWGGMTIKFVQLAGDDKLFAEIAVNSEEERRIGVRLVSIPGHLGSASVPRNRWAATPERTMQHGEERHELEPEEEYWVLSFDANDNSRFGSCAFLYLPEQVEEAEVDLTRNNVTSKRLILKEGGNRASLILWNFPDEYRTPELAYGYLSENGEGYAGALRGFEF